VYDQDQQLWEIFTETKDQVRVMAVFTDCKPFGDVMQIEAFTPEVNTDKDADTFKGSDKTSKSQNTGMDFVKNIVSFSYEQNVKIVLLITDFMTPHALKHINLLSDLCITHFSYEEMGVESMSRHISQPLIFRALDSQERIQYIREHPKYRKELQRYSINDTLVKYHGMKLDDIIYIEDNDRQTALVVEYGVVVEEL